MPSSAASNVSVTIVGNANKDGNLLPDACAIMWSGKRTHFGGKGGGEGGEAHNVGKEHSDAWMAVSHLG